MIIEAKTFKDWLQSNFTKEELKELAEGGAEMGWHGLIYYEDIIPLYDRFADEIWELVYYTAENFGQTPLEFIAQLRGAEHVSTDANFKTLLVWFAAEEYAYQLTEGEE